jgi:OOP family OmpA-OmpF porin
MKNLIFTVCCFLTLLKVEAQTKDEKWNIGLHTGITQYSGDLGQGFYATDQAIYGFVGVSVSRYLNRHFDLSLLLTRGQLGYLGTYNSENPDRNFRINLASANVLARYHLVSRESVFAPYLFAGGSILNQKSLDLFNQTVTRDKIVDFALPTGGIGFLIRFGPYFSFQFQEMFMYTWANHIDHAAGGANAMYLFHTVGFTLNLAKKDKMRNWEEVKYK